jgi:hypothetical protein
VPLQYHQQLLSHFALSHPRTSNHLTQNLMLKLTLVAKVRNALTLSAVTAQDFLRSQTVRNGRSLIASVADTTNHIINKTDSVKFLGQSDNLLLLVMSFLHY